MTMAGMESYPVRLEVDYPERMSRLTTLTFDSYSFSHT